MSILSRPAGVVFDMDDTLFRETEFVFSGYAAVSKRVGPSLGVPSNKVFLELMEIFATPDRSKAFNVLLDRYGREDLINDCVATYRNHRPDISLTQDASFALSACLRYGPVGLVTDGPESMQAAKVEALHLRERGVFVVLSDSLGGRAAWKPSPVGLLEVAHRMQIPTDQLVYVADNPLKDFLAATRAGMKSIRYRAEWQLHARAEAASASASPTIEIGSLKCLPQVLGLPDLD